MTAAEAGGGTDAEVGGGSGGSGGGDDATQDGRGAAAADCADGAGGDDVGWYPPKPVVTTLAALKRPGGARTFLVQSDSPLTPGPQVVANADVVVSGDGNAVLWHMPDIDGVSRAETPSLVVADRSDGQRIKSTGCAYLLPRNGFKFEPEAVQALIDRVAIRVANDGERRCQ